MVDIFELDELEGQQDAKDREAFTQELINRAIADEHETIEQFNNFATYKAAKLYRNGLFKVAKMFEAMANKVYNKYISELYNDIDDAHLLFEYKILQHCGKFYYTECNTVDKQIRDYTKYLFSGHMINAILLGQDRDEEQ